METPVKITSIKLLHDFLNLSGPMHPFISVFNLADIKAEPEVFKSSMTTDFYCIAINRKCMSKVKYGQQYYDFDDGMIYFVAPQQIIKFEDAVAEATEGCIMVIHPNFLHGYPLAGQIKNYGYFSYSANEALFLSEQEEKLVTDSFSNISREIESNIDVFTHDLIISNIDLILKYSDRFYNRQFLTRKKADNSVFARLEDLLDSHFKSDNLALNGIPTVQSIANILNLSPNYLSDMLKVHTGQTTQQHIHNRLIEKAKELLSITGMSVSEIAYQLGFEHPQSFHRLFKNRTSVSPLEFRQSFN